MHLYPIADFHCDLLCYLEGNPQRSAYDAVVRCSIPQMRAGGVILQVLAVFAETGSRSVQRGMGQVDLYTNLSNDYPKNFKTGLINFNAQLIKQPITVLYAFEGASTFCDEQEPLEDGLTRLETCIQLAGKPVYISLTWNSENRFGGGASTQIGLKEDGKRLLDLMHHHQIAVDFSHTSDPLAHDIMNYIDQHQLTIPIMASHSNARAVTDAPRNLPEDIAKEIIKRKGLIGMNFYRHFIGPEADEYFVKQLDYWIKLGAFKHIAFGADFFFDDDFPTSYREKEKDLFFPNYEDAGCYPRLLKLFQKELNLSHEDLTHLACKNALNFLMSFYTVKKQANEAIARL